MKIPSGWESILDQDEIIRWQGRPDSTVAWKWPHYISLLFGFGFSGFALIWMFAAAQEGGWYWMLGLIHFIAGLGVMFGPPYWSPYRRSRSWYTLTNKRALIATDMPILGRKIKSYPITPQAPVELETKYKSSVYFATVMRRSRNGPYEMKIGFERIANADHVFNVMREIQKENT